ncbi:MAG: hypothetical protein HUJ51_01450 [Eggerthellaceae bacterium]|nr:hypothetical protein [Eggerthellaceae bacterium]
MGQPTKEIETSKTDIEIVFSITRIKAVMINSSCKPFATGDSEQINKLIDVY